MAVFSLPLRPCHFLRSQGLPCCPRSLSHPQPSLSALFTVSHMQWGPSLTLGPKKLLSNRPGCSVPTQLAGEKRMWLIPWTQLSGSLGTGPQRLAKLKPRQEPISQRPLPAGVPGWGFAASQPWIALLQYEVTLPFSFPKGKSKKAAQLMSILTHHTPETQP